jgi:hypothetical protein
VDRLAAPLIFCLVFGVLSSSLQADDESKINALLAKAAHIPSVQFEFITTAVDTIDGPVVQEVMKVWRKGDRWRFESRNINPGQYTLILPDNSYTCLPGPEGCAPHPHAEVTEAAFFIRLKDPTLGFKTKRIIGHEVMDGKPCTMVELSDSRGEMPYKSKVWLWDSTGLAVRIESQALPEDLAGAWPVYENKNFDFKEIPDSEFKK